MNVGNEWCRSSSKRSDAKKDSRHKCSTIIDAEHQWLQRPWLQILTALAILAKMYVPAGRHFENIRTEKWISARTSSKCLHAGCSFWQGLTTPLRHIMPCDKQSLKLLLQMNVSNERYKRSLKRSFRMNVQSKPLPNVWNVFLTDHQVCHHYLICLTNQNESWPIKIIFGPAAFICIIPSLIGWKSFILSQSENSVILTNHKIRWFWPIKSLKIHRQPLKIQLRLVLIISANESLP
jgi:hypothetical protein